MTNTGIIQSNDNRGIQLYFNGAVFKVWNLKAINALDEVDLTFAITLPVAATSAAAVKIEAEHANGFTTQRVNLLNNLVHSDGTMTLSDASLTQYDLVNPIVYRSFPIINQVGPFTFDMTPQNYIYGYANDLITVRLTKPIGAVAGFGWPKFTSGALVSPSCKIGGFFTVCFAYEETNFFKIVLSTQEFWNAGVSKEVEITTDMSPNEDGIVYPSIAAYYEFRVEYFSAAYG